MPVHFGEFTLDESSRQLLGGAGSLHLSPKAFQLLSILIQERPRAVSKNDLQEQLWPDTFVTEGNLAGIVAELRTALGDDAKEARFIRTLYGFGYSFVAPVTDVPPSSGERPSAIASRRRWAATSIAALLGAAGIVFILSLRNTTSTAAASPPIRSIAVLPFDTSGADHADEHLGLGLPDVLITRLSNLRHLVVRPTSAIREFVGHPIDSTEAGRKLKVDAVLEGSVRTTPDRVRVTVQLLNVGERKLIWADSFDEKRTEMFAIEDNVSMRVAEALMMRLTPNEKSLLAKRYTTDSVAYELFLQGRYEFEQNQREGRNGGSARTVELFQKAVEKDPSYALAWALLAQSYFGKGLGSHSPRVFFENADAAAQKALQLDDNVSEAHCAAGAVKMYWNLDFAGAESEFHRALELNPRNTLALTFFAYLLQCLQRFDEATAAREREVEIDPLNPSVQWGLANAYLTSHQDERGIQQCFLVLRMNPNYSEAHIGLARVYTLRGEYDKAIAQAEQAVQIGGQRAPRGLAFLGYALGMAGRRSEANEILQQLKKQSAPPFLIAIVDLGLGDREAVFPLLEKGLDDRSYVLRLKTEPILDPLRSDSRFIALLRRAGFRS
jgi:TolB-like protein/DNA-binding winged helix-turn-helix (wHTH) protein/Tfp pilus assembly protein PilF